MKEGVEAEAFLARHFGSRATRVVRLASGYWSTAYSFELEGRELVVRFGRRRDAFEKDRYAATLSSRGMPVPDVLEVGDAGGGYSYAVSVRARGRCLEELGAAAAPWLEPAVWRLFDALRSVPVPAGTAASCRGGWAQASTSWPDALVDAWSGPRPLVKRLEDRLAAVPEVENVVRRAGSTIASIVARGCCPDVRHLIHGDLLSRNVLVDEPARAISAVLDWGEMRYGDFLFDVACVSFLARRVPALAATDFYESASAHFADLGVDTPHLRERLFCYELRFGTDRLLSYVPSGWWPLPTLPGPGAVEDFSATYERLVGLLTGGADR